MRREVALRAANGRDASPRRLRPRALGWLAAVDTAVSGSKGKVTAVLAD